MKRVFIYKRFERFWHWAQAALILLLALTGFEIHGAYTLVGFERAVDIHAVAGFGLIILIAFTIFWHFTTGEWRQYIPTRHRIVETAHFYAYGIFHGEPHPFRKSEVSKLNPLQRLTYLALKALLIPLMVVTGLLYYFYNEPVVAGLMSKGVGSVAVLHVLGAFALLAFLIVHIYLTTTGHAPLSHLKAMITGWEWIEE